MKTSPRSRRTWSWLALLALVACEVSREREVTPWLKLRATEPTIDWPHILVTGRARHEVLVRRGGAWTRVAEASSIEAVPLAGGGVLVSTFNPHQAERVFAGGDAEPVEIDPAICSFGIVTPDGARIVCADCAERKPSPDDRCLGSRLVEIGVDGRVIRVALVPELATLPECASTGPTVVGFTSDGSVLVSMRDHCGREASCRLFSVSPASTSPFAAATALRSCDRLTDWQAALPGLAARPPRAPVRP